MSSPTAKARAQVAGALAVLRAAQPPLTEARRAEIEARLAAADVRPDLQAVWDEDPTLQLALLLLDPAIARAAAPLLRREEPLPTPGPLGLILTIVSASDVAALAADLGLPLPPEGPGMPLLFDVDGHRGSQRRTLSAQQQPGALGRRGASAAPLAHRAPLADGMVALVDLLGLQPCGCESAQDGTPLKRCPEHGGAARPEPR